MSDYDCAVCGSWPPALRETMREVVDELPLRRQVCDECLRGVLAHAVSSQGAEGLKNTIGVFKGSVADLLLEPSSS